MGNGDDAWGSPLEFALPVAAEGQSFFPFETFRQLRQAAGLRCPRCGATRVVGWGHFSGRRRYRCRECRRTFSDFTGTPLAYIKRIDRWVAHAELVAASATIRSTACALQLSCATAFRWRHLLLSALTASDTRPLASPITVRATHLPISEKGRRDLARRPRRRGLPVGWKAVFAPSSRVTIVRSRDGTVASMVSGFKRPTAADFAGLIGHRTAAGSRLHCHMGEGALAVFARRHHLVPVKPPAGLGEHEAARNYIGRFRRWLRRFRGVATTYLGNYLTWHGTLEWATVASGPNALRSILVSGSMVATLRN